MNLKKVNVFRLCCVMLKKQFGKLFLVMIPSMSINDLHKVHIHSNRGAMFGLDARIALGIFGALSIISGAALYNTIQQSKIVSLITEQKEVYKAVEQYYIDTGQLPNVGLLGRSVLMLSKLYQNEDSLYNWKGPYWPNKQNKYGSSFYVLSADQYLIGVFYSKNSEWGNGSRVNCSIIKSGEVCYFWTSAQWLDKSFAESIDKYIDGEIDHSNGDSRLNCNRPSYPGKCIVYIKMGLPMYF